MKIFFSQDARCTGTKTNQCAQTSISLPVSYRCRDIQRVFEVSHVRRGVGIQQRGGIRTLRKKGAKMKLSVEMKVAVAIGALFAALALGTIAQGM